MNTSCKTLLASLLCLALATETAAFPKKAAQASKQAKPEVPARVELNTQKLAIAYLLQDSANPPTLPYYLAQPSDLGFQGGKLAIADNNTTGRFMGQSFELTETHLPADADAASAFRQLLSEGYRHILADLPETTLAALAKLPEAANVLIYDVGSSDDRLRGVDCSANLLHLLPSRAMRADALMQYLNKKNWRKVFLVVGQQAGDVRYAEAFKRAARQFGVKLIAEKNWQPILDARRTPESQIPVFTQGVDYDILIIADEANTIGDAFSYRTWLPRPVAGTQGLVPSGWHYTHELWGGLQLQNRFREQSHRMMAEKDYAAWLAVRAIGEAAARTKSADFDKIKAFMLSSQFALAGFKGVPLSFRPWDGQMRQPVLLADGLSTVAVAPIEGFLHQNNELDTLGYGEAETQCRQSK